MVVQEEVLVAVAALVVVEAVVLAVVRVMEEGLVPGEV